MMHNASYYLKLYAEIKAVYLSAASAGNDASHAAASPINNDMKFAESQ